MMLVSKNRSVFRWNFICRKLCKSKKIKKGSHSLKPLSVPVIPSGFKPETFWSVVRCSIQLSYAAFFPFWDGKDKVGLPIRQGLQRICANKIPGLSWMPIWPRSKAPGIKQQSERYLHPLSDSERSVSLYCFHQGGISSLLIYWWSKRTIAPKPE